MIHSKTLYVKSDVLFVKINSVILKTTSVKTVNEARTVQGMAEIHAFSSTGLMKSLKVLVRLSVVFVTKLTTH